MLDLEIQYEHTSTRFKQLQYWIPGLTINWFKVMVKTLQVAPIRMNRGEESMLLAPTNKKNLPLRFPFVERTSLSLLFPQSGNAWSFITFIIINTYCRHGSYLLLFVLTISVGIRWKEKVVCAYASATLHCTRRAL